MSTDADRPSDARSRVVDCDRRYVWHPYTAREDHETTDPFVIVGASGSTVLDMDGTSYLDGNASWWTTALGHGHPRLVAAIEERCRTVLHVAMAGATTPVAAALARELVAIAPAGLARVFFSDNGSTSVEAGLKMAFQYWRQNGRPERTLFLSLAGAYHGDTHGAMSVGDLAEFQGLFAPLLFEVLRAPEPSEGIAGWERTIVAIEARLARDGDRIAGLIVEPLVQGAAGMRMWAPELLRRLRDATLRADTFLIADEVFTGIGRTGRMWACEHAGVTPDILCTAKGLSGGVVPFAATLATDRVYDGFSGGIERALMHGHTFTGNPLGAAIAREVLAVIRDEQVIEGIPAREALMREAFRGMEKHRAVRDVRTLGMVAACDIGEPGYYGRAGWEVHREARRRGAWIRPLGNTVYLCPPLNIALPDLEKLLEALVASIEAVLD
jgi:adenosylmethionine-8-amino-7-oxononanoate aminotransferase